MRRTIQLILIALFLAPASALRAAGDVTPVPKGAVPQEKTPDPRTFRTIAAVPTAEPIAIDGVLSESVWKTAGYGGFTQRDPQDGQPATEPTT
ncbi:MAG: hypothetical protein IH583_10150, partial [Candidatus Aminicenantes bacterium]|nr:hypothetical protein [Candidatus Aminicenantes bacterium]